MLIADVGAPAPPGQDRMAHAGTLSFELSFGRERLIVNCGAAPIGVAAWTDAARATAAHSTLTIADTSSSELKPGGLGRRPEHVTVERQEANGAHWLEASQDGWRRPFGAVHRRRLYLSPKAARDIRGEDVIEAAGAAAIYAIRFHLHPGGDRQRAAGWRGGAAAPAERRLAAARGGREGVAGGEHLSGRLGAAAERAGGADGQAGTGRST